MAETTAPKRRMVRRPEHEEAAAAIRNAAFALGADGMWPLDSPGMAPPGPDFLREAHALGCDTVYAKKGKAVTFTPGERLRELYRRALREVGFSLSVEVGKGRYEPVKFIPGHIWGQHAKEWEQAQHDGAAIVPTVDGPHRADVFVLGKMPWREEAIHGRNLVGASGEVLVTAINRAHITGADWWYVSNLVKFTPPDGSTTALRAGWIADCRPLLDQELRIVRPKYILCLGADASKALLGKDYGVGYMDGRVIEHTYPVGTGEGDAATHTALVMTVIHPAEVARSPDKERILQRGIDRFALLTSGVRFDKEEHGCDHRVVDTLEDAEDLLAEAHARLKALPKRDRLVAWDAEWQGQHPVNPDSYVRCVQLSWAEKQAVVFKLRHAGGKVAFRDRDGRDAVARLVARLNAFMADKRACGHFLVSDLEWLHALGCFPTAGCPVPLYPADDGRAAWERLADGEGWLDTGMMAHAIEESAQYGLETQLMRYTTVPRYDVPLEDWKDGYCKEKGIAHAALEGYGDCPDHILFPYAAYDADGTRRLCKASMPLLDSDYCGQNCWEACWESMIAQRPILTIHQNGILVDRNKIDKLTLDFMTAREAHEDKIQGWAEWPDFNVRSTQHVREFLFGEHLNGKFGPTGEHVRIRPTDAKALYVTPLLDTAKPPRRWEDLIERGLEKNATPTTGKAVLGILAQENINVSEQIGWVRDHRFLDQVLKSVLRPPRKDDDEKWVMNDDGNLEYEAGVAGSIDADGRVRTHLYPTAETGRWRSARPNLQNISKSRDPDYERLLGKDANGNLVYSDRLRSIFVASPGHVLLEFDYKGAELYLTAILANCRAMIDHCERANTYPEDGYDRFGQVEAGGKFAHPEYYDIHSNVAVMAFKLKVSNHVYKSQPKDKGHPHYGMTASQLLGLPVGAPCPASKFALQVIGKSQFRTLAKNVVFGTLYGRGAKAIALQAREQGVQVSVADAQLVIDTLFQIYPELVPFFAEARHRAVVDKWMCSCFGRFRRFPTTSDYKMEGEFERQAMNFPIQSAVASAVDRGLAYLEDAIRQAGLEREIRLLLQMHDAGLLEVRYDLVPYANDLIKWAMIDMVPITPTDLAGVPTGTGPYRLGVDVSVETAWSVKLKKAEAEAWGIPLHFAKA